MMSSCSLKRKMENNYHGDLADIVRASDAIIDVGSTSDATAVPGWQFFPHNDQINYSSDLVEDLWDPFTFLGDPILQNMDLPVSGFLYNSNNIKASTVGQQTTGDFSGNCDKVNIDHEMRRPSDILSKKLQISPKNAKLPAVSRFDSQMAAVGSPTLLTNTRTLICQSTGTQISSPRNTAGTKRRKSQAKKVVCVPAPAPANSKAGGEIVPSDLWAWRKYGQKPIKGSPYPRGYYRCSSSKGCSARKQVERSRTDPNMLIITYNSEHNHPWPTQRNALAGSTRSQPSKTTSTSRSSPNPDNPREQDHKTINTVDTNSNIADALVDQDLENLLDNKPTILDGTEFGTYKPTLADSNQSKDNFFADLEELETDHFDLLYTQGFCSDDGRENKDLVPFEFYEWDTNDTHIIAAATITSTTTIVGSTTSYGDI